MGMGRNRDSRQSRRLHLLAGVAGLALSALWTVGAQAQNYGARSPNVIVNTGVLNSLGPGPAVQGLPASPVGTYGSYGGVYPGGGSAGLGYATGNTQVLVRPGALLYPPPTDPNSRLTVPTAPAAPAYGSLPGYAPPQQTLTNGKLAPTLPKDHLLVMNLCGRGDKDVFAVAEHLGVEL